MICKRSKVVTGLVVIYAGCHAGSTVGSGSRSTASVTSTWFWSRTWRVQGISWGRVWRGRGLDGWAWAVTGGRTGNQTRFWLVSHCRSGSQAVTGAAPPRGTLSQLIGNSGKPSQGRTSGSKISKKLCYLFPCLGHLLVIYWKSRLAPFWIFCFLVFSV